MTTFLKSCVSKKLSRMDKSHVKDFRAAVMERLLISLAELSSVKDK